MQIDLSLRATRTGHLRLIPNINRSGRVLPASVSTQDLSTNDKLDKERSSRSLSDKEIYTCVVDISPKEWADHPKMSLEVTYSPALFQLLNQSGIPFPSQDKAPVVLDLLQLRKASSKGFIQMFIEAQTFWGSPLVDPKSSPTVSFRILDDKGAELLSQSLWSGNDLRTADVILVGDDAPPERIFMCELDDNQPSVREVREGAKSAGVPLTLVPKEVGVGDTWLQDQFQLGYTATPEGQQRVILHLPRMRNDSALFAGTPNLRNFTDTYFPSQDIGVVKDLWRLTCTVADGTVPAQRLDVAQTFVLFRQLALVIKVLRGMFGLIREIDPSARPSIPNNDFTDLHTVRLAIETFRSRLMSRTNLKAEQQAQVMNIKPVVDALSRVLDLQGDKVGLTVNVGRTTSKYVYNADNRKSLQDFFVAMRDLHSSSNYGGNIEVSPPMPGAPYGKILAGSISSQQLRDFLTSRGNLHPLVQVFTEWLDVGHIDEIATFSASAGAVRVLRASPKLAADMLDRLVASQGQGVLVTRLFRGKKWIHESSAGSTEAHPPPNTHRRMWESGIYDLSGLTRPIPKDAKPTFGDAAYHDDRQFLVQSSRPNVNARYAAMISCADLLTICRATNRRVEDLYLSNSFAYRDDLTYSAYLDIQRFRDEALPHRLDKILADEFPGVTAYPLPVLFDWMRDPWDTSTSAIIPAMVNLQTLGTHVLVPRPYAPRMPVADAVKFMTDLLTRMGYPKTKVDDNWVRTRGLDKTWHWTRSSERVNRAQLGNMPTDFDPDYEEMRVAKALAMYMDIGPAGTWAISPIGVLDNYTIVHGNDPLKSHPVSETETLYRIAGYFKDGFAKFKNYPVDFCKGDTEQSHPKSDQYETDIKDVMDQINRANPGVFDKDGNVTSKDWVRITIPENTVDVFEFYTQVLMESFGLQVHWVDSWYYHTHYGGIHCGTNVLRTFVGST